MVWFNLVILMFGYGIIVFSNSVVIMILRSFVLDCLWLDVCLILLLCYLIVCGLYNSVDSFWDFYSLLFVDYCC